MTSARTDRWLSSAGSWWNRLVRGVQRSWHRSDWPAFAGADWAKRIMQVQLTDDFHAKQGRSTGRWILEKEGGKLGVYLKRHYRLAWWQGLLALVWPLGRWSPAMQEFRNLQWAQEQGLPVPPPVAVGEFIGPWTRLQSVLAIEELSGMLALHQAIPLAQQNLDADTFRRWKRSLAGELARLARGLHDRRRFHKDLYLCHFFIPRKECLRLPSSWQGTVRMIDFHRLAHHPFTWPWYLVKDLAEFLYSSFQEGVTLRDRLWFWRCYMGRGGRHRTWLARLATWKGLRYLHHNLKAQSKVHARKP